MAKTAWIPAFAGRTDLVGTDALTKKGLKHITRFCDPPLAFPVGRDALTKKGLKRTESGEADVADVRVGRDALTKKGLKLEEEHVILGPDPGWKRCSDEKGIGRRKPGLCRSEASIGRKRHPDEEGIETECGY